MATTTETGNERSAGRTPSPLVLRGLEIGALLQAVTELHLEGLLSDAEYRSTRRRLAAQI